jgi:aspartate ammonia-lyase
MANKTMSRKEKDDLGTLEIPSDKYFGIQSYRALKNFPISGTQVHPELIRCYLLLKKAAAITNEKVNALPQHLSKTIIVAIDELLEKGFLEHFIVDTYQAGAGTSQNMNINEVIANKANELLGFSLGSYSPIHPNDHVNMSQSTNDTYPTAMRLACLTLSHQLVNELDQTNLILLKKSDEFMPIIKSGRTHLQDAVPIRLGEEFSGYSQTIKELKNQILLAQESLRFLGIGGSACGNGVNVPKNYSQLIVDELRILFQDSELKNSKNLFSAMQSQLPMMIYSSALREVALELTRMLNDWRLLASGPQNGFAEIQLPAVQPGSSIMGGKVNPSMLEMTNQVCFKVIGNDHAMAFALQAGQLELNVMMPLMAHLALESTQLLINALHVLRPFCLEGMTANSERCHLYAQNTSQLATIFNPLLGHDRVALLVQQANLDKKNILQLIREQNLLSEEQIAKCLEKASTPPK